MEYEVSLILLLALTMACIVIPERKVIVTRGLHPYAPSSFKFKWTLRLAFVVLVIGVASALRGPGFGVDYPRYQEFYGHILYRGQIWNDQLIGNEVGWHYINLISGQAGIPSAAFFGGVSAVTYVFFVIGSHRNQHLLPLMFFFLFASGYFYESWNTLRQSAAGMIFLFSIKYIIDRKPINFIFSICMGSVFHYSIFALLPFYFVRNLPFSRNLSLITYVFSFAFFGVLNMLTTKNLILAVISGIPIFAPYVHVLGLEQFQEANEVSGTYIGFAFKSLFSVWVIFMSKKVLHNNPDLKVYFTFFVFYAVFTNIFFGTVLAARFLGYFYICFPLVASATVVYSSNGIQKITSYSFVLGYFLLYLVTTYKFVEASINNPLL